MKKIIFCLIIWVLNLPAAAIDYNDFPPNLQQILNERIAEVNANGGICVAGGVTMSDEAYIGSGKDVKVNFCQGVDEQLWIYDGGWFIMSRTLQNISYPGPAKLVLRAFGYDPIDASIAVGQKQITYVEFVMRKTPAEKLASISGAIVNDQNEPIEGAMVNISFPLAYYVVNEQPRMSINTEPNGHYSFEDLSITEYHLWVLSPSGHAPSAFDVTPIAGKTTIKNLKLYKNRSIVIDYVYQADGSRSFTGGEIQSGTIEWVNGHEGVDFSDGKAEGYEQDSLRDIEMRQDRDSLKFQIFYANGKNGFYDAGVIDFESLTEAAESGYTTGAKPCIVGHTYVVRTYEGNYAKFIVTSISDSE